MNRLFPALDGGPVLLYITKQRFGGKKQDRPLHSHDDLCELLLVYRGFGTYRAGGRSYPIQEGDVLFGSQDVSHEVRSDSEAEIGTYCFGFDHVRFPGLPENHLLPPDSSPVRPAGVRFPFFRELCETAYQRLDGSPEETALSRHLANAFLLSARELEEPLRPSKPEQEHSAERFREYLDEHFTEAVTLEGIATAFGCSSSYVSHVFKTHTGYTPIQYVQRRRVGYAQTLLITTDCTVTQIAALAGYDNTNYFNTVFAKIVGVSPLRYKKRYLEELRGTTKPE